MVTLGLAERKFRMDGAPAPHSYPSFVAFHSIGLLPNAAREP
jgi:hypothetical protein